MRAERVGGACPEPPLPVISAGAAAAADTEGCPPLDVWLALLPPPRLARLVAGAQAALTRHWDPAAAAPSPAATDAMDLLQLLHAANEVRQRLTRPS